MNLYECKGEAELEHGNLVAEVAKCQGQVVQSPERVRREMHESQRALASERREGEAAEAAALVASTAARAVQNAVSKVADASAALGEILDLSNKCIEISQQTKAREAATAAYRKDTAEVSYFDFILRFCVFFVCATFA